MKQKTKKLTRTKSYSGIYDIMFGSTPFQNVLYRYADNEQTFTEDTYKCKEFDKKSILKTNKEVSIESPYSTEKYKDSLPKNLSDKSTAQSTSTIFYDLDEIAKRHSFHSMTEISLSSANILKVMNMPASQNGFKGKANAIVQECATQINPKLKVKDSLEINTKKNKMRFQLIDTLSSEIHLRDKEKHLRKNQFYNIDVTDNQQKFWSFGKYRTEYVKPLLDEKKKKRKKGKRPEDPCPCQLFSYACPCTDNTSQTELDKSKCETVDQITSTDKIAKKKKTPSIPKEDKPTNTRSLEIANMAQEPLTVKQNEKNELVYTEKYSPKVKVSKQFRKVHRIVCPNCKERVEFCSTTEDEGSVKVEDSSTNHSEDITNSYNCRSPKLNTFKAEDYEDCNHKPRCDMVPICQLLPLDGARANKKPVSTKAPRIIRITKACRHHPPCTVVPSCQKENVLRNHCEYIPPCLHRPRCVNLPLCVPCSQSIPYEDLLHNNEDKTECVHAMQCKYIPFLENKANGLYNTITRVQNACEFLKGYHISPSERSTLLSSQTPIGGTASPYSVSIDKSCQCERYECFLKCSSHTTLTPSNEAIIFIRDVGCQFQNKTSISKDSLLRYKTSSGSYNLADGDAKSGNYYTAIHTMRCEDKFTNPKSGYESLSTDSVMTMEVDSFCPSHGHRYVSSKNRCASFIPNQRYVTGYVRTPSSTRREKSDLRFKDSTYAVKSRTWKGKYRKTAFAKRAETNNSNISTRLPVQEETSNTFE